MNGQNFGQRINPTDIVERNDEYTYNPVENSDPFAVKVPVNEALIHETPVVGTEAVIAPIDDTMVNEGPMNETIPSKAPVSETITHEAPISTNAESPTALLNREESEHFRTRWNEIQGKFVDEPRSAVQQADTLVSEVISQITQMFAKEHSLLESHWNQGNDVSTEDLRKALQHYRSFFNRLVV